MYYDMLHNIMVGFTKCSFKGILKAGNMSVQLRPVLSKFHTSISPWTTSFTGALLVSYWRDTDLILHFTVGSSQCFCHRE